MKTLVIAQTAEQVRWSLNHNISTILPGTFDAQAAMAKAGLNPDLYLKCSPPKSLARHFLQIADKFANNWFRDYDKTLLLGNTNFGVFTRMHWLFFIPELLRSHFLISKAIEMTKPDKVVIFSQALNLTTVDDAKCLDSFVAEIFSKELLPKSCKLQKVHLRKTYKEHPLIRILFEHMKYFLTNPQDIILAARTLVHKTGNIYKSPLLLQFQRHIVVDALPFIKELKKIQVSYLLIVDSLLLRQKILLVKEKINFIEYDTLKSNSDYSGDTKKLRTFWKKFKADERYSCLLNRHHLLPFIKAVTIQFDNIFNAFLEETTASLAKAEYTYKLCKPSVSILAGNSGRRGLAFAYVGKNHQSKVLVLQHGVDIFPVQTSKVLDKLVVWGEFFQRWYSKYLRIKRDSFLIPGWFYTDPIALYAKRLRENHHKASTKNVTILFALSYYLVDNCKQYFIIRETIRYLKDIQDSKLIIRAHPGQKISLDTGEKVTWDNSKDLDTQLREADIVICEGTTVGLRAMFWGKPLIHLKILNCLDEIDYTKYGAAIEIHSPEHLSSAVSQLMNNVEDKRRMLVAQKKFLKNNCGRLDGKSSQELCRLIGSLLPDHKASSKLHP